MITIGAAPAVQIDVARGMYGAAQVGRKSARPHILDALRFFDAIHRVIGQSPDRYVAAPLGQMRQHDHGHGAQFHDFSKKLIAVHARHLDIQGQNVGVQTFDFGPRLIRVARLAHHVDQRIVLQSTRTIWRTLSMSSTIITRCGPAVISGTLFVRKSGFAGSSGAGMKLALSAPDPSPHLPRAKRGCADPLRRSKN